MAFASHATPIAANNFTPVILKASSICYVETFTIALCLVLPSYCIPWRSLMQRLTLLFLFTLAFALFTFPAFAQQINVLVWDEQQPTQAQAYDNFLGNAIAAHLKKNPKLNVTTITADDPFQGLSPKVLNNIDVLIMWAHVRKSEVSSETGLKVAKLIQQGKLQLIALHSSHWASPFVEAMNLRAEQDGRKRYKNADGSPVEFSFVDPPLRYTVPTADSMLTPNYLAVKKRGTVSQVIIHKPICCFPEYNNEGWPSNIETLLPDHPIAKGIPRNYTIPLTEMYNEPFHIPTPDQVIFKETWKTGEWFRSGCVWNVGKGKVFYFRPGHETFPVFKQKENLKIVENATLWLGKM